MAFKTFASLRKNSGKVEDLSKQLTNMTRGGSGPDERIWKPTFDSAGNSEATIRFLPAPEGEDHPFVRLFTHGFKGPGGNYFENSRTTIDMSESDPVNEFNMEMWATEDPEKRQFVSRFSKRRTNFFANIYIIRDKGNPSAEGKVFLYRFGPKIFEKITEAANPKFADEDGNLNPINPFDFWTGANFQLRASTEKVGENKFPNYDKSTFGSSRPLFEDDAKLEEIWKQEYSLAEIIAPDKFKSYDELKKKLNRVMKLGPATASHPVAESTTPQQSRGKSEEDLPAWVTESPDSSSQSESGGDDEAFFKNLAADDDDIPF